MTARQKLLKAIYPVFIAYNRLSGKGSNILTDGKQVYPMQSFYDLTIRLNNGSMLKCDQFKGKKILLVNTASDCGYTAQYGELQQLNDRYPNKLVIIGFPANDFNEQEKGSDQTIAEFCKGNYGITFLLAAKSSVIKGKNQNEIFQWLTDKNKNGWNDQQPTWNFSKYLVDEEGRLINCFPPSISPLSKAVKEKILK